MVQSLNLALRFVLELCSLAALGYWGFQTGGNTVGKVVLALGAPLLAAVIWGLAVAPRRALAVSEAAASVVGLAVLLVSAAALYASGQRQLAAVFALVSVANAVLLLVWHR